MKYSPAFILYENIRKIKVTKVTDMDDRSYCFSLLAYGLSELRREHIKNKKRPKKENIAKIMPIKKGKVTKMFS